jgi:hypothetical protein
MTYYIGSARHDENGKLNGVKGDQLQKNVNDFKGEVSMQEFYVHSKGWYILRAKNTVHAHKIAERMVKACNNANIGYSQADRGAILKDGIESAKKTNTDCSALVRQCVKEATGVDAGNFTTANEKTVLSATGLFEVLTYKKGDKLVTGDILVTKSKGHTVIVISGENPDGATENTSYYPKYTGKGTSLVSALATVGEKDTSFNHRKNIATANGVSNYSGTVAQNLTLVNLLKNGKCVKA